MCTGDICENKGILGISFGITGIKVTRASHRQTGQVANANRGVPAQLQQ